MIQKLFVFIATRFTGISFIGNLPQKPEVQYFSVGCHNLSVTTSASSMYLHGLFLLNLGMFGADTFYDTGIFIYICICLLPSLLPCMVVDFSLYTSDTSTCHRCWIMWLFALCYHEPMTFP